MKCPKCKSELRNACCLRCGYMENGNQIKYNYNTQNKYKEQKLYNKHFDEMYRNEKIYKVFILGPLYFSYRGYFFLGTVLMYLDYLLLLKVGNFLGRFSMYPILMFCYIILNRVTYSVFSNSICLIIDNIKIKIIKKYYKENYLEKLQNYKHNKIYLLLTLIFYLIVISIFILIRRYENSIL